MGQFLDLDDYGTHVGGILVYRLKPVLERLRHLQIGVRIEIDLALSTQPPSKLSGEHLDAKAYITLVNNSASKADDHRRSEPYVDVLAQLDSQIARLTADGSRWADDNDARRKAATMILRGVPMDKLMQEALFEVQSEREQKE